jgi:structural maintenance of chromosome 2
VQIVIGGRNKYLINGHVAQPRCADNPAACLLPSPCLTVRTAGRRHSRVQNLFHSVQLNVNNPHFLIMQGRITKVLNMKPPEILSMLEEARAMH